MAAMARAMSAGSRGSNRTAASPTTSGMLVALLAAIGASDEHRLDQRNAEALEQRGKDEAGGAGIEGGQVGPRHVAEHAHGAREPVPVHRPLEPRLALLAHAREHQREGLAGLLAIPGERLDQARVILVVPRVRRIEDVARRQRVASAARRPRARPASRQSKSEPAAMRDRRDPARLDAVVLDHALSGELRDGDDVVGGGARLGIEAAADGAAPRRRRTPGRYSCCRSWTVITAGTGQTRGSRLVKGQNHRSIRSSRISSRRLSDRGAGPGSAAGRGLATSCDRPGRRVATTGGRCRARPTGTSRSYSWRSPAIPPCSDPAQRLGAARQRPRPRARTGRAGTARNRRAACRDCSRR